MCHMEGFVDKQTYRADGYIINVMMEYKGSRGYVWYVSKQRMSKDEMQLIKRNIIYWIGTELSSVIELGEEAIQRDLNRFSAGCRKTGGMVPFICVYYRQHIYSCGEEKGVYKYYHKPIGVFLSPEIAACLKEEDGLGCSESYVGKNVTEINRYLKKTSLLKLSQGSIRQAYFFIWEDISDV